MVVSVVDHLGQLRRQSVVFMLENLDLAVDHPGVPFARARNAHTLVSSINRPRHRLNLDRYYAKIGDGILGALCQACLPWIAAREVADVPGWKEPGSGDTNDAGVANALEKGRLSRGGLLGGLFIR